MRLAMRECLIIPLTLHGPWLEATDSPVLGKLVRSSFYGLPVGLVFHAISTWFASRRPWKSEDIDREQRIQGSGIISFITYLGADTGEAEHC